MLTISCGSIILIGYSALISLVIVSSWPYPKAISKTHISRFHGDKILNRLASKLETDNIIVPDSKQVEAVLSTGPASLVIAGAGAGKTRILSSRLAYLLRNGLCNPSEILVLSFTNDAAMALRNRADQLLLDSVATTNGVWCDTFHGFCIAVLRRHISTITLRKDLVVADHGDQMRILLSIYNKDRAGGRNVGTSSSTPSTSSVNRKMLTDILHQIRFWKEQGLGYLGVRKNSLKTTTEKRAYEIFPEYQRVLRSMSALDQGDLLTFTLSLFRRHPNILEQYRILLKHVLVDEFQEISPAQYDILRMLVMGPLTLAADEASFTPSSAAVKDGEQPSTESINGDTTSTSTSTSIMSTSGWRTLSTRTSKRAAVNVFCVGDDDQQISTWRGIRVDLMRRFRFDFPKSETLRLDVSYRVPETISKVAQSILTPLQDRIEKTILPLAVDTGNSLLSNTVAGSPPLLSDGSRLQLPESSNARGLPLDLIGVLSPLSADGALPSNTSRSSSSDVGLAVRGASLQVRRAATEEVELAWIASHLQNTTIGSGTIVRLPESTVRALSQSHVTPSALGKYSIAVLTKTREDMRRVTEVLEASKLPYRTRGYGAWVLPESGTPLLNLLRLLAFPNNNLAFESALDNSIVTALLSKSDLNEVVLPMTREFAHTNDCSLLEGARLAVLSGRLVARYTQGISRFLQKYDAWSGDIQRYFKRGEGARRVVSDILQAAYSSWSFEISNVVEDLSRAASGYDSFVEFMASLKQEGEYVVTDTLQYADDVAPGLDDMRNMQAYRAARSSTTSFVDTDVDVSACIWVMSIHAAKGLEFDEVMLPFWTAKSDSKAPSDEERRLHYVALTRARERVTISYSGGHDSQSVIVQELLSDSQGLAVQQIGESSDSRVEVMRRRGGKRDSDGSAPAGVPTKTTKKKKKKGAGSRKTEFAGVMLPPAASLTGPDIVQLLENSLVKQSDLKALFREALAIRGITRGSVMLPKASKMAEQSLSEAVALDAVAADAIVTASTDTVQTKALSKCTARELGIYLTTLLVD